MNRISFRRQPAAISTPAKLELPTFKGDALKWQGFWDQFEVTINNNETLNDIDRFSYLRRYLSGQALATISGLSLSKNNYTQAIKLLKERYGNPQVLITAHMESLLKVKRVKTMDSIEQLRDLYNDVESCVRNLKSLKVETSTYGCPLIPILNDRIPDELRVVISRKFGGSMWTLDLLLQYFNEELQVKERCVSFNKSSHTNRADHYTTQKLHSGTEGNRGGQKCVYCLKDHPPSRCKTVTNVDSRVSILRKYAKCFICLKSGHVSRNCTSKYSCNKCDKRHHISICKKDSNNDDHGTTHTTHSNISSDILLQTAKCFISNLEEEKGGLTRLMFDSGSQRSYITEDLRKRLNLKTLRKEKIVIKTFGDFSSTLRELDVVQFRVKNRFNKSYVYVEALSVPTICSAVTKQNIRAAKEKHRHLSKLTLADASEGRSNMDIDVLIGVDFYYTFVSGRVIRGEGGPVALESSLGWVLAGCSDHHSEGISSHSTVVHSMRLSNERVGNEVLECRFEE